ncbi:MAG: undecaprenyl-diphosphate phosphatase [Candidatus Omnitrophota bacterium]
MSYIQTIISGIVQGLTEFLPVSSSGHLVMLHHYFGIKEPQLFFDIILHVATLFAILVYFRRDIISVFTKERRLLLFILVGTIPTAIIGLLFKDIFESLFVHVKFTGLMLFITANFLFAGDWAAKKQKAESSPPKGLGFRRALLIGFVQALSMAPGISRSGSTIATGLLLRLDKKEAVRFSFLLAMPAILGALLFKLVDAGGAFTITLPMFVGSFAAFFVGLGAIHVLLKVVYTDKLSYFGLYCLIVGGLILGL